MATTMSPFSYIKPALGKCFRIEGGKVNNPSLHDPLKVWFDFYPDLVWSELIDRLNATISFPVIADHLKQHDGRHCEENTAFRMMNEHNLFHKSILRDPSVRYLTLRDYKAISLSPSNSPLFNLNKNEVLYRVSHRIRCPLLPCPCGARAHCGTRHPCGKRPKPANHNFEMWVLCVLCRQSVLLKKLYCKVAERMWACSRDNTDT